MIDHPLAPTPEDYEIAITIYNRYINYIKDSKVKSQPEDEFIIMNITHNIDDNCGPVNRYKTKETKYIEDYNKYCNYLNDFRKELETVDDISKSIPKDITDEEFIDLYIKKKYKTVVSDTTFSYPYYGTHKEAANRVKTDIHTDYNKIAGFYNTWIRILDDMQNKKVELSLEQIIFILADFEIARELCAIHNLNPDDDLIIDDLYNKLLEYDSDYKFVGYTKSKVFKIYQFMINKIERYFDTIIYESDIRFAQMHKTSFDYY